MKKIVRRVFAILMTFAIAITMIPTMEVKAEEGITATVTLSESALELTDDKPHASADAELQLSGIEESDAIERIDAYYRNPDYELSMAIWFYPDDNYDNVYDGTIYFETENVSGTYTLYSMLIIYENGENVRLEEGAFNESSIILTNNISDQEEPVISDVQMNIEPGTKVEAGDEITISAQITDNVAVDYLSFSLYGYNDDYYSYDGEIEAGANDVYSITLSVDDLIAETNSDLYYLSIYASDALGNNVAHSYEMLYFYLPDEEGNYTIPTYDTLYVELRDENEEILKELDLYDVPVYVSIEELIGEDCEPENGELGNFLGWSINWDDTLLASDEIFILEDYGSELYISPVFEKTSVTVYTEFLNEEGEWDEVEEEYIIEAGATYADLLAEIPKPSSVNGLNFVEWDLDGYELTDVIEYDYVNLYAIYDKEYVMVDRYVLDEYGYTYWTGYDMYIIEEGATYADILANYPEAEDMCGCGFVAWEYYYDDIDLNAEVSSGEWIDLIAIYDKELINVYTTIISEDGEWEFDDNICALEEGATYAELLEMLPVPETVDGCKFVKWVFTNESIELTDEINFEYGVVDVYAEYDNYPVLIYRYYVDQTGEVKQEEIVDIYPAGTKMEDIVDNYTQIPSDANAEAFEWIKSYEEGEIDVYNRSMALVADYEDKMIVAVYLNYIKQGDGYGVDTYENLYYLLDKTICENATDMYEYFSETIIPSLDVEHFSGYPFDEWYMETYENENGYYDWMVLAAEYDRSNAITVEMLIGEDEDAEDRYYVVEPGDIITLPTEFAGYYLNWEGYDLQQYDDIKIVDNKFVIPSDAEDGYIFWLFAEYGEKVPEQQTPPADNPPADNPPADTPDGEDTPPNTADTTTAIPYVMLLLLGAGVFMVGNKKRNCVK